jgi:hypothetical protein
LIPTEFIQNILEWMDHKGSAYVLAETCLDP